MRNSYSYSKRQTLAMCARKYFYEYYAAAKAVPFEPDRKTTIAMCKAMGSLPSEAGRIMHRMIAMFLKKYRHWNADWFLRTATSSFDRNVNYSRNPVELAHLTNERYPPVLLAEFAYADCDAEAKAVRVGEQLRAGLERFFRDPTIRSLYDGTSSESVEVEKKISGIKIAGFSLDGQIDFCVPSSEGLEIIDWKMGQSGITQDSLQLAIYGFWAVQRQLLAPEAVVIRKVFLGDGVVQPPARLDTLVLRRGKARIIQDIGLMKELDDYGRRGIEGAFTPCANVNICRNCEFRAACSIGSSVTGLQQTSVLLPGLKMAG